MDIGGDLQTIVFNSKDCQVVYQNRASRVFHKRCDVGNRMVRLRAGDWSIEAMRGPSVARRIVLHNRQDNPALGTSDHRQLVLCADL